MQQTKLLKEGELFFRQWLRSPKSMGSVIPSSRFLARAVAGQVAWRPGQWVVELGGGTGAISQGLIERGVPRDRLVVIELDRSLYGYLKERLPGCLVVQGDATRLGEILPRHGVGEVGTVISGLPMIGMPEAFQSAIIEQSSRSSPRAAFCSSTATRPCRRCPPPAVSVSMPRSPASSR